MENDDGDVLLPKEILRKISGLEERIAGLESAMAKLVDIGEGIRRDTGNTLFATVMERVAPELLGVVMPRIEKEWLATPDAADGFGYTYAAESLRAYTGRLFMSLGMMLGSLSADKAHALMKEAIALIPHNDKAYVHGYYLHFLRKRLMYSSEELVSECEEFEKTYDDWRQELKHIWAICIETHGRVGNHRKVEELVGRYRKNYELAQLEDVPIAAFYAHSLGVTNKHIGNAALLVEDVWRHQEKRTAEMLFASNTVAIVGGGDQEIGKGLGDQIDGHQLVVRVQRLPKDKRWFADYGGRVDMLSTFLAADQLGPAKYVPGLRWLFFPCGMRWHFVNWRMLDLVVSWKREYGVTMLAPPDEVVRSIIDYRRYKSYSAGLATMVMIKRYKPQLSRSDLYGFSHKYPAEGSYRHYDSPATISRHYLHNMDVERAIFDAAFPEGDEGSRN